MRKLQSLDVWSASLSAAEAAYRLTMQDSLARHFAIIDQVRRSSTSIPANLAEGYGLGTQPQLLKHLRIAIGSAYELRTHLTIVASLELIDTDTVQEVIERTDRCIALLLGTYRGLQRTSAR